MKTEVRNFGRKVSGKSQKVLNKVLPSHKEEESAKLFSMTTQINSVRFKVHTEDALAQRGDERRGYLR